MRDSKRYRNKAVQYYFQNNLAKVTNDGDVEIIICIINAVYDIPSISGLIVSDIKLDAFNVNGFYPICDNAIFSNIENEPIDFVGSCKLRIGKQELGESTYDVLYATVNPVLFMELSKANSCYMSVVTETDFNAAYEDLTIDKIKGIAYHKEKRKC